MDDLLKAYAQQRRQQGEPPLELHAASRKLLQEEVRRSLGGTAAPGRRQSLWGWLGPRWPRLALAGGLAAALVVLTVMMAPPRSSPSSHTAAPAFGAAPTTPSDVAAVPNVMAPAPAPAVMPAKPADKLLMPPNAPPAPAAIVAASAPGVPAETSSLAVNTVASAPLPAATPAPPPAAGPAPQTVVAAAGEAAAGQEFVQISNSSQTFKNNKLAPTDVLSVFQMVRSGQNVTVKDSDGSIYNGQVLEAPPIRAREGLGTDRGMAAPAAARTLGMEDANANYSFKVIGVNNSLRQNIVFTGKVRQALGLAAKSGALQSPRAAAGAPAGQSVAAGNTPAQSPAAGGLAPAARPPSNQAAQNRMIQKQLPQSRAEQNLRVTGKVQVDGGGEFEIEAAPRGP
jgi:hypothetical protein